MFSHILLAADGSECGQKAALHAARLSEQFNAKLSVVHVFTPPLAASPLATGELATGVDPTIIDQWASASHQTVEEKIAALYKPADVAYAFHREFGDPSEAILRVAESEKVDLIVLGSRGLSGIKEFLLGSVSNRISHHAHCPVLIVK